VKGDWRGVPRRLHELSVEHWIVSGIVPTLPGWYALFVRFFGGKAGLVSSDEKSLTTPGIVSLAVVFVLCSGFALLKAYVAEWDTKVKKNNVDVLQRLLESVNAVTGSKTERFVKFIRDNKGPIAESPFHEITQPLAQIEKILENLRSALGGIHDIGIDHIAVSLLKCEGGDWSWLGRVNCVDDLEISDLVKPHTSFRIVMIDKTESTVFFPDKRVGQASNMFVFSRRDHLFAKIGSIIVRNLTIEADREVLPVALSITTYGNQFCDQDDDEAKRRILEFVLPCFESRLRLELCLYYIKSRTVQRA
jgi:hypothetical protein